MFHHQNKLAGDLESDIIAMKGGLPQTSPPAGVTRAALRCARADGSKEGSLGSRLRARLKLRPFKAS